MALKNENCVKSSIVPQAYKVVNTHADETSWWKILSIFLHMCAPDIGGMNDYLQSYLSTLSFNKVEQIASITSYQVILKVW